jgi:biotin carboxyl carrier protein
VKYYARIDNNEYEIEINEGVVLLDGEPVEVDMVRSGVPELYSVLFGGGSYEMLVAADRFTYTVNMRGEQFQVQVEDERARRLNRGRRLPALPDGELAVTAPIPGLVVKLLAAVGESIEEGQPLVILEAMKMENELRSMRSGVIKEIVVGPGQRVEQNAVLLILE